ncbi:MAG: carbohydrate-binding protein, partial [Saprospiraceae bacterium]
VNPNLWHDTYWKYLSFIDPQAAIDLYNSNPNRDLKFGISDAQTYHWLHAMNALGTVDASITADYPVAVAFKKDGQLTYVGYNYTDTPITITFSDGYTLLVPANLMATSRDIDVSGVITSDFQQAYANGSVNLSVATTGSDITKVEFFDGIMSLGEDTTAPYEINAANLGLGVHGMYAKVYAGTDFTITNIINIQVGEQVPFTNTFTIPGIIEAGNYDVFEGGVGQNISYVDSSQNNEGDYRTDEYVDATSHPSEGKTVGWITAGEWLEYSIDVQITGFYDLTIRYASGNPNGGGPFHLEIDGNTMSPNISMTTTSDWDSWASKTINTIELTQGEHILRLVVTNGEFNLGKMDFVYASPLGYVT